MMFARLALTTALLIATPLACLSCKTETINVRKEFLCAVDDLRLGRDAEVVERCTCLIENGIETPQVYLWRATAYFNLFMFERAVVDCCAALEMDPEYDEAYFRRGEAKIALRDYEGAIEDLEMYLRVGPDLASVYRNLGVLYDISRNTVQAVTSYKKCLLLRRDDAEVRRRLNELTGIFDEELEGRPSVEELLEKLWTDDAGAGEAARRQLEERKDEAIKFLRKSARTPSILVLANVAAALEELGWEDREIEERIDAVSEIVELAMVVRVKSVEMRREFRDRIDEMLWPWIVEYEVVEVLKGEFSEKLIWVPIHSPSRDLGSAGVEDAVSGSFIIFLKRGDSRYQDYWEHLGRPLRFSEPLRDRFLIFLAREEEDSERLMVLLGHENAVVAELALRRLVKIVPHDDGSSAGLQLTVYVHSDERVSLGRQTFSIEEVEARLVRIVSRAKGKGIELRVLIRAESSVRFSTILDACKRANIDAIAPGLIDE